MWLQNVYHWGRKKAQQRSTSLLLGAEMMTGHSLVSSHVGGQVSGVVSISKLLYCQVFLESELEVISLSSPFKIHMTLLEKKLVRIGCFKKKKTQMVMYNCQF